MASIFISPALVVPMVLRFSVPTSSPLMMMLPLLPAGAWVVTLFVFTWAV